MMEECETRFGIFTKRNHCRYCGKLICSECCLHSLPHFDPNKREKSKKVKVCDGCYEKYKIPHFLNVDQMHFVSKAISVKSGKGRKKSHSVNDIDDIWSKYPMKVQKMERKMDTSELDQIFGSLFEAYDAKKTEDPLKNIWNEQVKETLHFNDDNVRNLAMFGFSRSQIDYAWNAMQQSDKNQIGPKDGPLFIQTMLDFLYSEQKK